jgi:hypothetical protein
MYIFVTHTYPYHPVYHLYRWFASDTIIWASADFFDGFDYDLD